MARRKQAKPAARDYPDKLIDFVEFEWAQPSDDEEPDPRLRTFNRKCRWIRARCDWADANDLFDMDAFCQELGEPV